MASDVIRCGEDASGVGFGHIKVYKPSGVFVYPVCTCNADQSGHLDDNSLARVVARVEALVSD